MSSKVPGTAEALMAWTTRILCTVAFAGLAASTRAGEQYETTTSITTYATRSGINPTAKPAFLITAAQREDMRFAPEATRILKSFAPDGPPAMRAAKWRDDEITVRSEGVAGAPPVLTRERVHGLVKSGGAIVVGAFLAPELAIPYAVGAGATGLFKPLQKVVRDETFKDEVFARLALQNQAGGFVQSDYRAFASDRSGLGDLIHYSVRHVKTRRTAPYFSAYVFGEFISYATGRFVKWVVPAAGSVIEEVAGTFIGAEAEETVLRLANPAPESAPSSTTFPVPDGRGGVRFQTLPRLDLRPLSAQLPPTPKLQITLYAADPAPPAVEPSVSTFRVQGAASVTIEGARPGVITVRPNYFNNAPSLGADAKPAPPPRNDHALDLPTSVEIHGLGSFKIRR